MDWIAKQRRIYVLAEDDDAYVIWKTMYLRVQKEFEEFAATQPAQIQDVLRCYAECGRIMNQRLLNLACMHMEFSDEAQEKEAQR